jgi:hypothetical protein
MILAVDQLAGGTADDNKGHIIKTVNKMADLYSRYSSRDFNECQKTIVGRSPKNTMTDRAAVNHATVAKLEEEWGNHFKELNCNLHPLDSFASECHLALKKLDSDKGEVFVRLLMSFWD